MIFKEENGQGSMRRTLAFIFAIASIPFSVAALFFSDNGWIVFIPGLAFIGAAIILLFFTTWADIKSVIEAVRK